MIAELLAPPLTVLRIVTVKKTDSNVILAPGVSLEGDEYGSALKMEKWEELQNYVTDPNLRHVLVMSSRPGAAFFARYLELTYFHPDNYELNDLYQQCFFKWNDLHFTLVSVPSSFDNVLHETAAATGMRLVDQALPIMFGDGKQERLPLHDEFLYTMENQSGHIIYTQGHEAACKQEDIDIEKLENEKLFTTAEDKP